MYFNIITNIFTLTVCRWRFSYAVLLRGGVGLLLSPWVGLVNFVAMALGLSRFFAGIPISSR